MELCGVFPLVWSGAETSPSIPFRRFSFTIFLKFLKRRLGSAERSPRSGFSLPSLHSRVSGRQWPRKMPVSIRRIVRQSSKVISLGTIEISVFFQISDLLSQFLQFPCIRMLFLFPALSEARRGSCIPPTLFVCHTRCCPNINWE